MPLDFRQWIESRTVQEGRSGSLLRRSAQYLTGARSRYSPANLGPEEQSVYAKFVMLAMKNGETYDAKSLVNLTKALLDGRRELSQRQGRVTESDRIVAAKKTLGEEYPLAPTWLSSAVISLVKHWHRYPVVHK